ncbi:hypothetical protein D9757_009198 [Collybiopsis confluens]|uniref:AB hydrolase-1 domain-containing protein n=1 Tax=Collybiopsis confluens TaxID=2823264 RepID=A0A8H5H9V3_9AGAR|nr:hypothetical protein D9757_009198 [Collybiopsis confluens]
MPFVEVKTRYGRTNFQYTISTPLSATSSTINPSLPVILWFHALVFPHVFHSQFSDPLLRKFNLVVFSFRTQGDTGGDDLPEGYGVKETVQDVLAFMDAIDLPPCHFVAMDYGSPVALEIAMSQPGRVLSLCIMSQACLEEPLNAREGHQELYDAWDASFPGPKQVDVERSMEVGFGFGQLMFSNKMTTLAQCMFKYTFWLTSRNWDHLGMKNCRIGFLEYFLDRKSPSAHALSRIQCPVKLLYGTDDIAYPQSHSEQFLHDLQQVGVEASLYIVEGAPHYLCVDFADEIDPIIHDFIMQNEHRQAPPVVGEISSPWLSVLRTHGWNPEGGNDSDDDDFFITYPSSNQSPKF